MVISPSCHDEQYPVHTQHSTAQHNTTQHPSIKKTIVGLSKHCGNPPAWLVEGCRVCWKSKRIKINLVWISHNFQVSFSLPRALLAMIETYILLVKWYCEDASCSKKSVHLPDLVIQLSDVKVSQGIFSQKRCNCGIGLSLQERKVERRPKTCHTALDQKTETHEALYCCWVQVCRFKTCVGCSYEL